MSTDRIASAKTSVWAMKRVEYFLTYLHDEDRKDLIARLQAAMGQAQVMKPPQKVRGPRKPRNGAEATAASVKASGGTPTATPPTKSKSVAPF